MGGYQKCNLCLSVSLSVSFPPSLPLSLPLFLPLSLPSSLCTCVCAYMCVRACSHACVFTEFVLMLYSFIHLLILIIQNRVLTWFSQWGSAKLHWIISKDKKLPKNPIFSWLTGYSIPSPGVIFRMEKGKEARAGKAEFPGQGCQGEPLFPGGPLSVCPFVSCLTKWWSPVVVTFRLFPPWSFYFYNKYSLFIVDVRQCETFWKVSLWDELVCPWRGINLSGLTQAFSFYDDQLHSHVCVQKNFYLHILFVNSWHWSSWLIYSSSNRERTGYTLCVLITDFWISVLSFGFLLSNVWYLYMFCCPCLSLNLLIFFPGLFHFFFHLVVAP